MSSKYLVLSINEGLYAIAVSFVHKVAALPGITRLPHTPPYILGVAKIDGSIYTIIDLRVKFEASDGLSEPETGILLSQKGNHICMVGDQIFSLIDVCQEDILLKMLSRGNMRSVHVDATQLTSPCCQTTGSNSLSSRLSQ